MRWFHVQRTAAGEGQLAGFPQNIAEIGLEQAQAPVFEQFLHGSGIVDVGFVRHVTHAPRPEPVDAL